jgi:hypothetical protein
MRRWQTSIRSVDCDMRGYESHFEIWIFFYALPQHFKITPVCARMWSGVMSALQRSSLTLLKVCAHACMCQHPHTA